ncbi:MAG: hypothetical protein GYA36_20105, partial [Veillonellaceae bacterium]|nr:hypothetical protein [Veillonellaceae bacterium]
MKRVIPFLWICLLSLSVFSQVPEKMSYQAVIRNGSNALITNAMVGMQLSILQGSPTGTAVFVETQTPTTNGNGLITVEIGTGTVVTGSMASIDWTDGPYYLKTEVDLAGGTNYTLTGTSQLLSVPFALYAKTAGNAPEIDGSVTNEIQTLSISHDTIYLSNGGFVKLPAAYITLSPPDATTLPADSIQSFSAVLNGTVNPNNLLTSVEFEWGVSSGYGNTVIAKQSPLSGITDIAVSAKLTSLTTEDTYHYRIKATNAVNVVYSSDMIFTLTPTTPLLTTANITSVTGTTAVSGGTITYNGGSDITGRGVCWGISASPDLSGDFTTDGSGFGSFTSNLTLLTPGTTYYVRAYATNSSGTGYGDEKTFTTVSLPAATTGSMSDIKGIAASGSGTVTDDGGGTITAQGLCWSTSTSPTISDSITTSFEASLKNLTANTVYYVRAYVTNEAGTAYGNEVSFNSGYEMGTSTQGGLVFYNDGDGHGLVCANADADTSASWGCYGTSIATTSTDFGTGAANTAAIVTKCTASGIAAKLCDDLVVDVYDDWYLPSKAELNLMYINLHTQSLGSFEDDNYWSSSEVNSATVWYQRF